MGIVLRTNVKRGVGISISELHFLTVTQITYIKQGSVIHELCEKTALQVILPTGHLWRQKKDTSIEYELANFTNHPYYNPTSFDHDTTFNKKNYGSLMCLQTSPKKSSSVIVACDDFPSVWFSCMLLGNPYRK